MVFEFALSHASNSSLLSGFRHVATDGRRTAKCVAAGAAALHCFAFALHTGAWAW